MVPPQQLSIDEHGRIRSAIERTRCDIRISLNLVTQSTTNCVGGESLPENTLPESNHGVMTTSAADYGALVAKRTWLQNIQSISFWMIYIGKVRPVSYRSWSMEKTISPPQRVFNIIERDT
eukprot:3590470-Amphidinium_carterae.1